jgi:hypothetical protein
LLPFSQNWEKGLGDEGQIAKLGCTLSGGVIEVKYFYSGGDLSSTPEIVTIIPKIYRQDSN